MMDKTLLQYAIENVIYRHVTTALWDVYLGSRRLPFGFYLLKPSTNRMIMDKIRGKARTLRSIEENALILSVQIANREFDLCSICGLKLGTYKVGHAPNFSRTEAVCDEHLQDYLNKHERCQVERIIRWEEVYSQGVG